MRFMYSNEEYIISRYFFQKFIYLSIMCLNLSSNMCLNLVKIVQMCYDC